MNIDAIHENGKKLISFVIPCYHSEGSVGLVIDEIRQVVAQRPDFAYQIIAVNDCSPDGLLAVIRKEAEEDPNVIAIDLAKNGGRHNALICGCHYADGDYVVFIDDDQQCPADRLWDLMDPLLNGNADVSIAKYPHKTQSRLECRKRGDGRARTHHRRRTLQFPEILRSVDEQLYCVFR